MKTATICEHKLLNNGSSTTSKNYALLFCKCGVATEYYEKATKLD
jgi:hypothetical protein